MGDILSAETDMILNTAGGDFDLQRKCSVFSFLFLNFFIYSVTDLIYFCCHI